MWKGYVMKFSQMFKSETGKSYAFTFALVCTLFFLWALCNGMIDVLNKHFQNSLHISKAQSAMVQFSNYIGYFLMALPAGIMAKRFGYKAVIIIGLFLIAAGAVLVYSGHRDKHFCRVSFWTFCNRHGYDVSGNRGQSLYHLARTA